MKRFIAAALLIILIAPASALAETKPGIEVDTLDKPVKITGWLGEENAFIGNIRLTANEQDVKAFTFLPADLKRQKGDEVIGRQQLELIGEPQLTQGVPKDFRVKVNGLQLPGTYEGQIELLLPGQKRSQAIVIPVQVMAKARPNLQPLTGAENLQVQLVRCSLPLDCGLAHWLLPAAAFSEQWQLRLDNPVKAPVSLTSAEVVLRGQRSGYQITKADVEPPKSPQDLPANQIINLPVTWKRSQIPPDRYTGAVYLTLEGREGRLVIPVDLSMRTGPLLPLLFLLVGVIGGRFLQWIQQKGIPQSEALQQVNELEQEILAADAEDQKILLPMLKEVRNSVYKMDLETVTTELAVIKARLQLLVTLHTLQQQLLDNKNPDVKEKILPKLSLVRQKISLKRDDDAKNLLEQVEAEIEQLQDPMMGSDSKFEPSLIAVSKEVAAAAKRVQTLNKTSSPQDASSKEPLLVNLCQNLRRGMIVLSGVSSQLRAEANFWFVRPLFSLAVLCGLSVVGIRTLYVDKGVTFGAEPLSDYLGLILWGLSADVASRSLSNLPGGEEKKE